MVNKKMFVQEHLVVTNVIERLKYFMELTTSQVIKMNVAFSARTARYELLNVTALEDDDPCQMKATSSKDQVECALHALLMEFWAFGHQSRFDFMQYSMAELYVALNNSGRATNEVDKKAAVDFYTNQIPEKDQTKKFLSVMGVPHVGLSNWDLQIFAQVALPRLFMQFVKLQVVLGENIQNASDVQAKLLAGAVSVSIAFCQLAAGVIKQLFLPACLDVCHA